MVEGTLIRQGCWRQMHIRREAWAGRNAWANGVSCCWSDDSEAWTFENHSPGCVTTRGHPHTTRAPPSSSGSLIPETCQDPPSRPHLTSPHFTIDLHHPRSFLPSSGAQNRLMLTLLLETFPSWHAFHGDWPSYWPSVTACVAVRLCSGLLRMPV